MSVKIESGRWTTIWRKKKASTAFVKESLVCLIAGFVAPAPSDAGAADKPVLGVYIGPAYGSGDATTVLVPVAVPIGPALIRATTSALVATDEGGSFDMTDDVTVNRGATTYGAVTLVKYVSATEGLFAISKSIYANVA